MPVQFRGSEYKNEYKWQDSFKSKSFNPAPEQAMTAAGQASTFASTTIEPPLQHKKRLEGPPTSLSTNYFDVPSREPEFTLLGQQEKFAKNVKYQPKQTAEVKAIYKNKENFYDAPPPSKQLKMQKRIKPLIKERHPPVRQIQPAQPSLDSPPPAPRERKDSSELKEALKDKDLKDILGDEPQKIKSVETKKTKNDEPKFEKGSVVKKEPSYSNMNASVQTNVKKGIAQAQREAPAEYALKYKAGVAPPRPLLKVSEYQKQFQWKGGMKASPLLAAEQIVYTSNADLGPYKSESVPKVSEYKQQFKEWKPLNFSDDALLNINQNKAQDAKEEKKKPVKRSKSAGAVLRREKSDKEVEEAEEEVEEKEEEPSSEEKLKAKLSSSHGKIRRLGTEYRSNFKAPLRYSYEQGAWKGAAPPQLMPAAGTSDAEKNKNNSNKKDSESESAPLNNWFAEVLELRRRAQEYRKRAQGTHFSREHLVQLMAKQNACWDVNSEGSQTLRALNLDVPVQKRRAKQEEQVKVDPIYPVQTSERQSEKDDREREEALEEEEKIESPKGGDRVSRKMAWLEEQKETVAEQRKRLEEERRRLENENDGGDLEEAQSLEGRLPTPVLKGVKSSHRHHLDLTTPSVGGAILTSPPCKESKMIVTSRSGDSYVTASDDFPVKSKPRSYNLDLLVTIPPSGKPSGDTHPLRDDSALSDRPLVTQYVASPPLPASMEDKENQSARKCKGKRKSRKAKPSNLTTIKEGYSKTYNKQNQVRANYAQHEKDEDILSTSLMSVASSQSLASDIFERAKRRQNFWDKSK